MSFAAYFSTNLGLKRETCTIAHYTQKIKQLGKKFGKEKSQVLKQLYPKFLMTQIRFFHFIISLYVHKKY